MLSLRKKWPRPSKLSKKLKQTGGSSGQITHITHNAFLIPIYVEGRRIMALVDTGASVCCIRSTFVPSNCPYEEMLPSSRSLVGAYNRVIYCHNIVSISFTLLKQHFKHPFHIINCLSYDLIIGLDFLALHDISLNCRRQQLLLPRSAENNPEDPVSQSLHSLLSTSSRIPPCKLKLVNGAAPVKQPLRRKAFVEAEFIRKEVRKMLDLGIIQESHSPVLGLHLFNWSQKRMVKSDSVWITER